MWHRTASWREPMKYLSLFSGIGGFELGFPKDWECVGFSEIDKYAIQIYQKHFNHKNLGDITKIKEQDLPEFDLLVGGFPCQSFSIAGKRGGFSDTRGTLFFDIARILKAKQPRLLLLENVEGLLSHDEGRTFATIISTLDELGYDLQWQVLNSKNFGVPQNRERVFIVGNLRGTPRPKVFPFGEDGRVSDSEQQERIFRKIQTNGHGGGKPDHHSEILENGKDRPVHLNFIGGIKGKRKKWLEDGKDNSRNFSQGQRVYGSDGISQTLAGNAGGQGGKTGLYAIPVLTPDRPTKRQNGRRFKHGIFDGMKIRRLTPTECERLQGFPDDWTKDLSRSEERRVG